MASAAERAVEVVDDVLMRYDDLFDSIPADVVEALMADPDLLVDLAIEAGGLEQADGAWLTAARCNHDAREWCPVKEHTETPLYRRASRPAGEDRPKGNDDA